MTSSVAVVGAGWAGCAGAVALAEAGHRVTLYEAAPVLGGRARTIARDGLALDNGQHLLLGAYTATRALIAKLHDGGAALRQRPLSITPLAASQPHALALRARGFPAPFGLALGLLAARGLALRDRLQVLRVLARWRRTGLSCPPGLTVEALLAPMPTRASRGLWEPLCVAALNTPPARASAAAFLNVLGSSFDAGSDAADLVLPSGTLAEALPDAAARWLARRAHVVMPATRATVLDIGADHVMVEANGHAQRFDAAIVAVGPHQLSRAIDPRVHAQPMVARALDIVQRYDYESITTVYLGYRGARIGVPEGLVRLDDDPGHWLFERADILRAAGAHAPALDQLFAVVISASGSLADVPHAEVARACDAQLRRGRPALEPLAWSRVIAERRATYACTTDARHPAAQLAPRAELAGDYVYAGFPATLEGAVRSGQHAAAALAAKLGAPR